MAFSTHDTIVAIATPPGRGGIGVVRISGGDARAIARAVTSRDEALEPRRATLTVVRSNGVPAAGDLPVRGQGAGATGAIDEGIATYFPSPHSYTGEDVVELSMHGSPVILRAVVAAAVAAGARLAEPGEFTLRAFLNGRIDLPQAESVADLVDAVTPLQARAAFDQLQGTLTRAIAAIEEALFDTIAGLEASVDFPEEGYHFVEREHAGAAIADACRRTQELIAGARRGRLIREGLQVAIVGKPNVGKSSLFNALAGAPRAIVTEMPGTTRDLVTDTIDLGGFRVTLVDTAGLHDTSDVIEAEGVARSEGARRVADVELLVLDGSRPIDDDDRAALGVAPAGRRVVVLNKADLPRAWNGSEAVKPDVEVSATRGAGLERLQHALVAALDVELVADRPDITNLRHVGLVEQAHAALVRAQAALADDGGGLPEEFVLADLQQARAALEEITGRRANDELLARIFSRFCIGK